MQRKRQDVRGVHAPQMDAPAPRDAAGPAQLLLLLGLLVTLLPGCASEQVIERDPKPFKVVLMPVDGAEVVLEPPPAATGEDGEEILSYRIEPALLRQRIRDGVVASKLFSEMVVLDDADLSGAPDERLAAAAELARDQAADLILRVRVNSASIRDLGPNDSKYWSSLVWFMVPAPVWFVNDRTYDTDLEVRAELFQPEDLVRPTASAVARPGPQELDLWDRMDSSTLQAKVLIMPSTMVEGDPGVVSNTLTRLAVDDLVEQLIAQLEAVSVPARFTLDVTRGDGGTLRVDVRSARRLRSLEVLVDGRPLEGARWVETRTDDLLDVGRSTEDQWVYAAPNLKVGGEGRREVRVIAEDEVGAREVRTLVLGGSR